MDESAQDEIAAYRSRRLLFDDGARAFDRRGSGGMWPGTERRQPSRDRRCGTQRRASDRHLFEVLVALERDLAAKNVLLAALRGDIADRDSDLADE